MVHRPKFVEVISPQEVVGRAAEYRPLRPQALQPASHRGKDLVEDPKVPLVSGRTSGELCFTTVLQLASSWIRFDVLSFEFSHPGSRIGSLEIRF